MVPGKLIVPAKGLMVPAKGVHSAL